MTRKRFHDIAYRVYGPASSDTVALLCPGLPASPGMQQAIDLAGETGWRVVDVSFAGSPGISGKFLQNDSAEQLSRMVAAFRTGKLGISARKVFVIGSSFGGAVALRVRGADRVVAISPVPDFSQLYRPGSPYTLDGLRRHLAGIGYKIDSRGWRRLVSGEWNPDAARSSAEKLVVFSPRDPQLDIETAARAWQRQGASVMRLRAVGHFSWRKLPLKTRASIRSWLSAVTPFEEQNESAVLACGRRLQRLLPNAGCIALVCGSLASRSLVASSDIDVLFLSHGPARQIAFGNVVAGRRVESRSVTVKEFFERCALNPRWFSRLASGEVVGKDKRLMAKYERERARLIRMRSSDFRNFLAVERIRLSRSVSDASMLGQRGKKALGGRRDVGGMVVAMQLRNGAESVSLYSSLRAFEATGVISPVESLSVFSLLDALLASKERSAQVERALKTNARMVSRVFAGLATEDSEGKPFREACMSALLEKSKARRVELLRNAKSMPSMKRFSVLYFLAANAGLTEDEALSVLVEAGDSASYANVRRIMTEHGAFAGWPRVKKQLRTDSDMKVRQYALGRGLAINNAVL